MIARWGATNVTKLARELAATKYKNPTREQYNVGVARRLLRSPADVSLESIAAAAAIFKLKPWQLLLPNLDPEAPQSVMSAHDRETLEMFRDRLNIASRQPDGHKRENQGQKPATASARTPEN